MSRHAAQARPTTRLCYRANSEERRHWIFCERYGCVISVSGCRARYIKMRDPMARKSPSDLGAPYSPQCVGCEQGQRVINGEWRDTEVDMEEKKKAYKESMAKAAVAERHPLETHRLASGSVAELRRVNPDAAILASVDEGKKEQTKRCRVCGADLPLSSFRKHSQCRLGVEGTCKKCKGKVDESRSSHVSKKRLKARPKAKPAPSCLDREESPAFREMKAAVPKMDHKVTIDFHDYPEAFDALVQIARDEFRSPAQQALYFLVTQVFPGRGAK